MNIIGLGKAGCKIAELFKQYPQYNVFLLDSDDKYKRRKNCFFIPPQQSAELYDANAIDLSKMIEALDEDEEVYFITCGSGKISACSLWILKEVRDRKIRIIYVKPDMTQMDNKSVLRNRAHFHILQEYTRSGVFDRIFLFDNTSLSEIAGKTSIINFYSKINSVLVSMIHWMNVYDNSDPVFDTFKDRYISSRICCISAVDVESETVSDTFMMKNVNQVEYFFGVNRIRVENDEELLDKLTTISSSDSEDKSVSYGVYPTELEEGFSFAIKSSSEIQSE